MTPISISKAALAALALTGLAACASDGGGARPAHAAASMRPYEVGGRRYAPQAYSHYEEVGVASWYSYPAHTRRTASGEWFDPGKLTAAHKTLPIPCTVEVTNLDNGRSIEVRVNDRGPFAAGRLIDLSRAAADRLGVTGRGVARVRVKLLGPAPMADVDEIGVAGVAPEAG